MAAIEVTLFRYNMRNSLTLTVSLLLLLLLLLVCGMIPTSHSFEMTSRNRIRFISRDIPRKPSFQPSQYFPQRDTKLLLATYTAPTYYLSRIIFIRALAIIYGVAFTIAWHQNKALIGDHGITPAKQILDAARKRAKQTKTKRVEWAQSDISHKSHHRNSKLSTIHNSTPYQFLQERLWDRTDEMGRPLITVLWLAKDQTKLNPWIDGIAIAGFASSVAMLITGTANFPLLLIPYISQRSLMAVGGPWYGYGWEPQLAELGFHALFIVPFLSLDKFEMAPPALVLVTIRWFLFRIMLGAGLIKIKAQDKKWRDLTAMEYFYETQPVPNPLSKTFHMTPKWWHRFEVLMNHFVELIAPWLLLLPFPSYLRVGGIIQLIFQIVLISAGNLSFLNWLTAIPAVLCLDDAVLNPFFPAHLAVSAATAGYTARNTGAPVLRNMVTYAFTFLIARLSVPVVRNLSAKQQIMNGSFDPLRLVNTYGAFGVVEEVRKELIISSAIDIDGEWREYDFPVKPGDIMRRPRWISPYHFRLDWQLWIAACFGGIERSPWLYTLLQKLLEGDEQVMKLLANDPWNGKRPKYIRIETFRYGFHRKSDVDKGPQPFWDREYMGRFYPKQGVASLESLKGIVGD